MAGRPRSTRVDDRLAVAVAELLADHGYAGTTVDAVAARSGVAKTAIYRRWRSKAEMVFALAVHRAQITAADTGSLAGDLLALARDVVAALDRPAARAAMPGLLDGLLGEPDLAARFRSDYIGAERAAIRGLLDRAHARGELPAPVDASTVHAHLLGAVFTRLVLFGERAAPDLAVRLAHEVRLIITTREEP